VTCLFLRRQDSGKSGRIQNRTQNLPTTENLIHSISTKIGLEFPATLIGRLARDRNVQSKGIGGILLMEALELCYKVANSEIASIGVLVDPIDENAIAFYRQFGFEMLPDINRMFLPMGVVRKLIEGGKTF
jgi:GNAT superfamily N-acetyltransferase